MSGRLLRAGESSKVLTLAVATALAAGVGFGNYLRLPDRLGEPLNVDASTILTEDPGLSEWRAVIAGLGGLGATFVVPVALHNAAEPDPTYYDDLDREMARLSAEIDAQMRQADVRRAYWAQQAQGYRVVDPGGQEGYALVPAPPPVRRYTSYPSEPVADQHPAEGRYTSYPTDPAGASTSPAPVQRYTSYAAEPPRSDAERAAPAEVFTISEPGGSPVSAGW